MITTQTFVVLLMMLALIFVGLLASALVAWLDLKGFNASPFYDRFGDMSDDAAKKLKAKENYINDNEYL